MEELKVVKQDSKIYLFTSDGKLQKQLPIPGKALSVNTDQSEHYSHNLSWRESHKIFNMENETVTKVITLDKECYGLSFSNNSLAVGLITDEIRIIDLEGNTLKSMQLPLQIASCLANLVYCNDRVTYSDYYGKAVYCVDESDPYGNIIVTDYNSNRIIVISKDGQDSKVLISEENELEYPRCICFKHNESSGFICDENGTYLAKFNLSS
ncbi:unnamed protein product [Mytilus edulis]|uniref:Uncharacterized protein n=1 Tax=Mytilus edulis TaxID=6550 RepID=A0A8S3VP26_MYTED|nr:unnamed protein product [Mytilus edulis]